MSAEEQAAGRANPHPYAHVPEPHGTLRDYLIGFGLSAVLTVIPFWLVMGGAPMSRTAIAAIIITLAVTQMVVHVVFFLHMKAGTEDGWSLTSIVFTLILVGITVAGSVWVMYHLDRNMTPAHEAVGAPI
jgi:cytochrome o ubiquinol oxidase operon protein cyoD